MEANSVMIFLGCVIFLFVIGRFLIWPLKTIGKLILNSLLGGILLFFINLIGGIFGFHIGVNYITAIIVGILGIPGAILLIVIKMMII